MPGIARMDDNAAPALTAMGDQIAESYRVSKVALRLVRF
jgi:hypothetical protein